MAQPRTFAAMQRGFLLLVSFVAALLLAGCGGGSGAPNNPYQAPTVTPALEVAPSTATLYASTPVVFTVTGGTQPYSAFSSDSSVLPLTQQVSGNSFLATPANVAADTDVVITVRDSGGRSFAVSAKVKPAPLVNGLTVAAEGSPTSCGGTGSSGTGTASAVVCSGDTGTVTARLLGPGGTPVANRQVRFDVVQGDFAFYTAASPSQAVASSVTVTTDQAGNAIARFQARVTAPSAFALVKATDLTTNNQVTGSFTIAQITDGSKTLRVVPDTSTITSAFKGVCSSGFVTDYYVFGGTPPYRIAHTYPNAGVLSNAPVLVNGGAFRMTTNGQCVDPMEITITDATGRTTTAKLVNKEGTADIPTAPPPAKLAISPASISLSSCIDGTTRQFTIVGGTPPYSVSSSNPGGVVINSGNTASPNVVTGSGGTFLVTPKAGSGQTALTVVDSGQGSDQQTVSATISCP